MDRPVAVVIGLDTVVGLQASRVLHDRGVPVIGIAADPGHYCARTRSVQRVVAAPTAGAGLVAALGDLLPGLDPAPVLVPCRDPSVHTVSAHRDELVPARILLPSHEVVVALAEKASFVRVAESAGVHTPRTWMVRDAGELAALEEQARFPVVLKPSFRDDAWQDSGHDKGYKVGDLARLSEVFDRVSGVVDRFVVQEWVPGPAGCQYTCNVLFGSSGEVRGTFVSRKIRQWPPDTGVGSMGVAVVDAEVEELTVRLFESVGYRGLGYLEVKRDPRDGMLVAIEANVGRPTGRSALADRSGVELLYGMYREAIGDPMDSCGTQVPTDRAWVHLRCDLQSGLRQWRRGEVGLAEWLGSYRRPLVDAVASWRDPAPLAADVARSARKGLRRLRPSRGT